MTEHAPTYHAEAAGLQRRYELRHQLQEFTDTTAAYHRGEDVIPGDCWRACIASLMEVPLAEVPHFGYLYPGDDLQWWHQTVAWIEENRPGWTLRIYDLPVPWLRIYDPELHPDAPDRAILTGPSPRGDWNHSVLVDAQTGELEHDPMPGGDGVAMGPSEVFALVRAEWLVS